VDYGRTSSAPIVRAWAESAYENWLHSIEVPASSVMSTGALAFSTVFDISSTHSAAKSLQRVRQPLIDYCRWLDEIYEEKWRNAQ
jgi:chromosome partitioning protein